MIPIQIYGNYDDNFSDSFFEWMSYYYTFNDLKYFEIRLIKKQLKYDFHKKIE